MQAIKVRDSEGNEKSVSILAGGVFTDLQPGEIIVLPDNVESVFQLGDNLYFVVGGEVYAIAGFFNTNLTAQGPNAVIINGEEFNHGDFSQSLWPAEDNGGPRFIPNMFDFASLPEAPGSNEGGRNNGSLPQSTPTENIVGLFGSVPPVAVNDFRNTDQDSSIIISVLANDQSFNGAALRVLNFNASGMQGNLVHNGNGIFTYNPNGALDYLPLGGGALEQFTYTVIDGNNNISTARVFIFVNGLNDAPEAMNDWRMTTQDDARWIDVLRNDEDIDRGAVLTIDRLFTRRLDGEARIIGDRVRYNPDGEFDYLPQGWNAIDRFWYEIADEHGATDRARVTVLVKGLNDAPEAMNDWRMTTEDDARVIRPLLNDEDVDITDGPWNFTITRLFTRNTDGEVTLSRNGRRVTYDPDGEFDYLATGEVAWDSFRYEMSDVLGATDRARVFVQIKGVNDAPEAMNDRRMTTEDEVVRFNPLRNDTDVDHNDDPGNFSVDRLFTRGLQGEAWLTRGGRVAYDPDGEFDYLATGETAIERFGYEMSDDEGATSRASIRILIKGVNDAPDANDDMATTNQNSRVTIDVLANDTDPDHNDDPSNFSLDRLFTRGTQGDVWIRGNDTVRYDPDGQFDSLGTGETAYDYFWYEMSDNEGATSTAQVRVTIEGRNDRPEAMDDNAMTDADASVSIDVLANDTDVDASDMPANFVIDRLFQGQTDGDVSIQGNQVVYDPAGAFDHLLAGETAYDTFSYRMEDDEGLRSRADVTVKITGVNDAPTLQSLPELNSDSNFVGIAIANGIMVITTDILKAMDPDNIADDLVYNVQYHATRSHGHVAIFGDEQTSISSFTQADVDAGRVVFVHDGSSAIGGEAGFFVRLTDGNSTLPRETIRLKVVDEIVGDNDPNTIRGTDDPDFIRGRRGDDTIRGDDSGDVIQGGRGDDILIGRGGDDIFAYRSGEDIRINGGGGDNDILRFAADGGVMNLADDIDDGLDISRIERISLLGQNQELRLAADNVGDITDGGNTLYVSGNSSSSVQANLFGWTALPMMNGYNGYTDGTNTLYVHMDINQDDINLGPII
ncbi:MAG: hypothetical protein CMF50_10385 [Legionellales bacterium]|nr:hypothetical protein [Legionellales bacterium]